MFLVKVNSKRGLIECWEVSQPFRDANNELGDTLGNLKVDKLTKPVYVFRKPLKLACVWVKSPNWEW